MHTSGTVLRSRYRIIQPLGSGGFGKTYLAEDLDIPVNPKPLCVVKHLKPRNQSEAVLEIAKNLFDREAETLYRLGNLHNQIPRLFAHFEENGEFYLVQEFINGHDLSREIIPGVRWSEAEVEKLLKDILEVLVIVHQQHIIHRDIKPPNIMRRRQDGKIVLIDFGAVKEIKGLVANTQGEVTSTILIGTNGYMPDEQANRKPRLSSDVYAVGMLGIQALTGIPPHQLPEDPSTGEIIWRDMVDVSDRFAEILTTMVRAHFSQRYPSAIEALEALNKLPPLKKPVLDRLQFLSNRKVSVISALVLLTLVASLYVASRYFPSQQAVKPKSPTPTSPPTVKPKSPTPTSPPFVEEFSQLPCDDKLPPPPLSDEKPTFENLDYRYYGDINPKTNEANGSGLMVFKKNEFQYYGEFKNNKRHGCGKLSYPKNSRIEYYLGQFEEDNFQGLGRLKWRNGNEYRGNFVDNQCQGQGVFELANNSSSKSGLWKEDKLDDLSCK
jgi:serine/threonine protein kinase